MGAGGTDRPAGRRMRIADADHRANAHVRADSHTDAWADSGHSTAAHAHPYFIKAGVGLALDIGP